MSITRITEGEHITEIEKGWTVFTDEFEAYAGQFSYFTATEGTIIGKPEKDQGDETDYFIDAWWSSDKEGAKKITESNIGKEVYFHIKTKNIPDTDPDTGCDSEIAIQLNDYDKDGFHDAINVTAADSGARIIGIQVKGNKAVLPLSLAPGLENAEEIKDDDDDDDVRLFLQCSYREDFLVPLPKEETAYLLVKTCDKKVEKSYQEIGYGNCAFYQFRYNDFMRRHKDCGHVPPEYYYGPMLKINEKTENFFEQYALTPEMKTPVGMDPAQIKKEQRLGVDCKPVPYFSYGFKYCVRFTHVLMPKLTPVGQDWLIKARKQLQELMDIGVVNYNYEAKYDKVIESMESTFNKNFEPTKEEVIAAGKEGVKGAIKLKKEQYYRNIELMNKRFQEFAFATHPEAYDPKKMSELPLKDLALISLSPDFKEWIGAGAYGTWMRAAIVAGNLDYGKLISTNIEHYSQEENSGFLDSWEVVKGAAGKIKDEAIDLMLLDDIAKFVQENSITNGR